MKKSHVYAYPPSSNSQNQTISHLSQHSSWVTSFIYRSFPPSNCSVVQLHYNCGALYARSWKYRILSGKMGSSKAPCNVLLVFAFGLCTLYRCSAVEVDADQTAWLVVNASEASARKMPKHLFGLFFEEINHAGSGGLWAELVSNRGFESGGRILPSGIAPWSTLGDESSISVSTDLSSSFERNKVALRMEVLCDSKGANICPAGGVGVYNPGFWGMNIEQGKTYKLVLHIRSLEPVNLLVSLTDSHGLQALSNVSIMEDDVSKWTKVEALLDAKRTNHNSRLQLTTTKKGVIWFDQVSLMPLDTYKGHGFRNDLFKMLADLKPGFLRFPGGCFVEGEWLRNAFRWKETIGPWEKRPGHFGDVWNYWTDDGLGHFEFLQLAEDLGAEPIWEILDGIEFARGDRDSTWGSVRAAMGHPEPFVLRYVAIGNEDCGKPNYLGSIVQNQLQPYQSANTMFSLARYFDHAPRNGPKAFVSEYAVHGDNSGAGKLLGALAEASFLIGLEKNSTFQVVNFGSNMVNLKISIDGLELNPTQSSASRTVLASKSFNDENSFQEPKKVVPMKSSLDNPAPDMDVVLSPYSLTGFDLLTKSNVLRTEEAVYMSSAI
ncbi:hypothetical protein RJ639_012722 [Escallonia herrerae]|uniref:non-reducing end alpha-L-arabinofuranosidase n=1 Tax=Escallonia herrerae TaxID=1293975 RepID=A0AA89APN5_9ASTE|nr:hypothetical protein RJ639_012722 [Escallonia herrerae]